MKMQALLRDPLVSVHTVVHSTLLGIQLEMNNTIEKIPSTGQRCTPRCPVCQETIILSPLLIISMPNKHIGLDNVNPLPKAGGKSYCICSAT